MIPQADPQPGGLSYPADDAPDAVVDLARTRHAIRHAVPELYTIASRIRPDHQAEADRLHDVIEDLRDSMEQSP